MDRPVAKTAVNYCVRDNAPRTTETAWPASSMTSRSTSSPRRWGQILIPCADIATAPFAEIGVTGGELAAEAMELFEQESPPGREAAIQERQTRDRRPSVIWKTGRPDDCRIDTAQTPSSACQRPTGRHY